MWIYNDEQIISVEQMPEGAYGFIYLIENLDAKEGKPRFYIGKKTIWSERRLKLGKRELQQITDKRKSKYKQVIKEADWLSYSGSCKELLEDIKKGDRIVKKILKFTYSKMQNTYEEVKTLFQYNVLESDDFYNQNIAAHWYKGNIGQKIK